MAKGDTRLWRKTGATNPLFRFTYGSTVLDDSSISSVAIHRGGEGAAPSTLEVATDVFGSVATGEPCSLALTPYGAGLLLGDSSSSTATRFVGRLGQQSIDDRGKRQYTTYYGASITAQHPAIKRKYSFPASTPVRDVIRTILNPPSLPPLTVVNMDEVGNYGVIYEAIVNQDYSELIGKMTTDLGIVARNTRAGDIQLLTNAWRNATAVAGLADGYPLARSQGLAPAQWEQANDTNPRNILLKYRETGNVLVQDTYGDPGDVNAEVVELDMSYIRFLNDAQPRLEATARRSREWLTAYALPSLKVDLLLLLSSGKSYDLWQARRLLAMQVHDPIYLSGDWHNNLRGIHYAEEITETITPNEWTLDFSLLPSQEVTGHISPDIPARIWGQANYPWGTETRKWAQA